MQLVLASTSPRRRELLALLGLSFDVCSPIYEEQPIVGLGAKEQAAHFALEKAQSVARIRPDDIVLGSDTVIDIGGTVLGKPADIMDALTMLRRLAGRVHEVHTAVALCCQAKPLAVVQVATAHVAMCPDDGQAITRYLETTESLGKAGAYSIQGQGSALIERIEGDFTTVVGLPLRMVALLLGSAGYPFPNDVENLYRQTPYPNWGRFSR